MRNGNMARIGLAVILSGGLSLGLAACGKPADDASDGSSVTETVDTDTDAGAQDRQSTTGTQTEDVDVTTYGNDGASHTIVQLENGWEADKGGVNEHMSASSALTNGNVTVDVFANTGSTRMTARQLAESMLVEAGGQGVVDETLINGEVWSRFLLTDENGMGAAYHDNPDGTIRKLMWNDCSFQDAVNVLSDYDLKASAGEI